MKVSVQWLRQLVSLPDEVTTAVLAARLTQAGLEVEAIETVGHHVQGVVVAEVRGVQKHPAADRLRLVDVFDGQETTQVVCGAPNVPAPGSSLQVLWARPGARLPSGLVQDKEVRGVWSPGMLCSAAELGLPSTDDGLLLLSTHEGAVLGADVAVWAGLADEVLELKITPNRPDCLGHMGVARELVVLFGAEGARWKAGWNPLQLPAVLGRGGTAFPGSVHIEDATACPRYQVWWLTGVQVQPSPWPTRLLLERLGVRPTSNVVDATQLAMLLWGQPLHAWDAAPMRGTLTVRYARAGETLLTLDGHARTLATEDVVIADERGPLHIAGVLGGKRCAISADTHTVVLESAYFNPLPIRKTAKRLRVHTDASHRFERGVDPNRGVLQAGLDAVQRLRSLAQAEVIGTQDLYPTPVRGARIAYAARDAERHLGLWVAPEQQQRWLEQLECTLEETGPGTWQVEAPTHRPDLTRSIDLVEEIGRLVGYDNIPTRLPSATELAFGNTQGQQHKAAERTRDVCVAQGLIEVQSLPFTLRKRHQVLGWAENEPEHQLYPLHNPLREELSLLRSHLVLDLLDALKYNQTQGRTDIRLFEVGEVFVPTTAGEKPVHEQTRVAVALAGRRDGWLDPTRAEPLDVFDVRGVVDNLLTRLGCAHWHIRSASVRVPWLHPGATGEVVDVHSQEVVGWFGEVHPDVCTRLDIAGRVYALELHVPSDLPGPARFVPWSKYPAVTRDFSFFVQDTTPVGMLLEALRAANEPHLVDVWVRDEYREGGQVPVGQKGLLLQLVYRSKERTLTDAEVQTAHEALVQQMQQTFSLTRRV